MSWFWQKKKKPISVEWADVIGAYGNVLENNKPGVGGSQPEEALPYDKATIKSALVEAVNQDGLPDEMINALGVAYISLAKFRSNGGGKSPYANVASNIHEMTNDQLVHLAKQVSSSDEVSMLEAIKADQEKLLAEWTAIKAERAR